MERKVKHYSSILSRLILAGGSIVLIGAISFAQDWADREYGVGLVGVRVLPDQPPGTLSGESLVFYSSPSEESPKAAVLHGDSLKFTTGRSVSFFYESALEYAYEDAGFPILEFTRDSSWIKVSLNCWDTENRTTGWVRSSTKGIQVLSWTEIISQREVFFFLKSELIHFFTGPDPATEVQIQLASQYSRPNYSVYRKRIQGEWMLVELETPSSYCYSEEEVVEMFGVKPKKRTVWIRFLDERRRPTIFYNTRGC